MKRILSILVIALLFLLPPWAMAAGTVTQTYVQKTNNVSCLTYSWTADASAHTVPATASTVAIDGYVILVVTNPDDDTAPTDQYDITLTDADSCDVMGGTLADRSDTNTEQAVPKIGNVYGGRWVSGILTLNISNNSVNSAAGTVAVYIQR